MNSVVRGTNRRPSLDTRELGPRFPVPGSGPEKTNPKANSMAFSLAALLIYNESVPLKAREALRAVNVAPLAERKAALRSAAQVLRSETAIDCGDALELVGLQYNCGCE